jgi:hypothetical protein
VKNEDWRKLSDCGQVWQKNVRSTLTGDLIVKICLAFLPLKTIMSDILYRRIRFFAWCFALTVLPGSSGCSALKIPALPTVISGPDGTDYVSGDGMVLQPSNSAMAYKKVREAKAQNCVVLQIAQENPPIRTLPLPPEGQSVFVSDLLNQTGILEKMGAVDVTLYRDAPGMPGGVKMVVKMSRDHDQVRPESDYSLQAGDRLTVQKAKSPPLSGMFSALLGM